MAIIFVIVILVLLAILYNVKVCVKMQPKNETEIIEGKLKQEEKIDIKTEENPIWEIKIPSIQLEAEISEGTDTQILNSYVGHFSNTDLEKRKCRISCT